MKIKLPRFLRPPPPFSHEQTLRRLAALGFAPPVIYDIGAFHGYWTKAVRKIFPAAQFVLFEANAENTPKLAASGERFIIAALGSEDGAEKNFYIPKNAVMTGASLYKELSEHYSTDKLRIATVKTRRLDAVAAEHRLPSPDLIKLDVQGAELDVLAGAGPLLTHARALIVEVSLLAHNERAPLMAEVIAGIDRLGFKCVDILDVHKAPGGAALQLDMLFVGPVLFEKFRVSAGLV
jgi:FkbM family methyltransferase